MKDSTVPIEKHPTYIRLMGFTKEQLVEYLTRMDRWDRRRLRTASRNGDRLMKDLFKRCSISSTPCEFGLFDQSSCQTAVQAERRRK